MNQEQSTPLQIPLQTVDADQLPRGEPLSYNLICQMIGDLYIETTLTKRSKEEQFSTVTTQLKDMLDSLRTENDMLKKELAKYERLQKRIAPSANSVGQD